jgi:allantoin racemase
MMLAVARAAAPVGVAVEGATAAFGAALITDEAALAVAGRAVVEAAKAAPGPFDGVVVSAFGDPGLEDLRESAPCPVTGLAEAAMAEAAAGGRRFAVATTTPDLAAAIDRRAAAYGHRDSYIGTYVTPGDPVATTSDPAAAATALAELCRAARRDGAEAVVVGGGPLAFAARRLAERAALPIIEPVPAAIRLALVRAAPLT